MHETLRIPVSFKSGAETCGGFLHRPAGATQPAVVLMGNGLATEWHFGTADFIAAFTKAGLATLNFDYRHFGLSSGKPRQLLDFRRQLEDWRAALHFLRSRDDIDTQRIALWGSSLGGGHALMLAADEPGLAAVVVQVPHLDTRAAMQATPWLQMVRTLGHAAYDGLRAACGLSPHTLPVAVEPGELGLLGKPGWKQHYLRLVPKQTQWRNAVPARSVFSIGNYNPIDTLAQIQAPTLMVYGREDSQIPAAAVEAAASRMPAATLWAYDGDHFGVYHGPSHAAVVAQELAFLRQHLRL